jgi:hypothetical protein
VHGRDSCARSNCDTADGSNCKIVNCLSVRAGGINSLYQIRREVICRVIHPTRDNIFASVVLQQISNNYARCH